MRCTCKTSQGDDKLGARDMILNTKVARRAWDARRANVPPWKDWGILRHAARLGQCLMDPVHLKYCVSVKALSSSPKLRDILATLNPHPARLWGRLGEWQGPNEPPGMT